MNKICKKCGEMLPLSEYEYCRDAKSNSGRVYLRGQCRTCRRTKESPEKLRSRALKWKRKYPDRLRVHRRVLYAIETGKLTRLPCEVCGETKVDGHHDDYNRPLEVNWLCRRHHAQRHRELRNQ